MTLLCAGSKCTTSTKIADGGNLRWAETTPSLQATPCMSRDMRCEGVILKHKPHMSIFALISQGEIPNSISNLVALTELNMSYNFGITGLLPPEVGSMANLTVLHLYSTGIHGKSLWGKAILSTVVELDSMGTGSHQGTGSSETCCYI